MPRLFPSNRNLFYIAMILVFCVLAPLVLFYAQGYRLDTKTGHVVRTGVLVVSSKPNRAAIVIDASPSGERTNARIDAITAGAHRITVQKKGYAPWEKVLRVNPGASTIADHIVLFKANLKGEDVFSAPDIRDARAFGNKKFLIVQNTEDATTLSYWSDDTLEPTIIGTYPGIVEIVALHEPEEKVLFRFEHNGITTYRIGDLAPYAHAAAPEQQDIKLVNLGSLVPAGATIIAWDLRTINTLWVLSGKNLLRLDVGERTAHVAQQDVQDILATKEGIVVLSTTVAGSHIQRLGAQGQDELTIDTDTTYSHLLAARSHYVVVSNSRNTVFLDAVRPGITDARSLAEPMTHATWQGQSRLLLWSGTEILVYQVQTRTMTPIARFAEPLRDAAWYADESYIFYAQDTKFVITETDVRDRLNGLAVTLPAGTLLRSFSDKGKKAWFFTAPRDVAPGKLWFVQLR